MKNKKEFLVLVCIIVFIGVIAISWVLYKRKVQGSNYDVERYTEEINEDTIETQTFVLDYYVTENIYYSGYEENMSKITYFTEVCEAMEEQGFIGNVQVNWFPYPDEEGGGYEGSNIVWEYQGNAECYMRFTSDEDSHIHYDVIADEEGIQIEEWESVDFE